MPALDSLLTKMARSGASDLHLAAGEPVRMRLHGALRPVGDKPLDAERLRALMHEVAPPYHWQVYERTNDVDFAYGIPGVARFRCNYFRHLRGPGAVFRRIPETVIPLGDLGLPESVARLPQLTKGLVLVTGPTGSGKSTTLAAVIHHINHHRRAHIVTIEDPIEFLHTNAQSFVVQREVGTHTPSFSEGLKDALTQSPDVILVGELRDLETMSLAISAAEMGILVLGTLHTNCASKTIDRLVDAFPANQRTQVRNMLADSLQAVVSQQLIKRKDDSGREVAVEVLLHGPGLANIIRDGNAAKLASYIEAGKGRGMQLMDDALADLVQRDRILPEDAYLKATDKARFEAWMQKSGFSPPQ